MSILADLGTPIAEHRNMPYKLFRTAVLTVALAFAAAPAFASPITIEFEFLSGATVRAEGSFTYDSSIDGTTIEFADLSAFSITALGVPYNLAFLNSGGFGPYYYMSFNSATNTFIPTTIDVFPTVLAAIKSDFSAGFFIRPPDDNPVITEYSTSNRDQPYDTLNISRTSAVPEPGTLVLLGSGLIAAARRRLRRKPQGVPSGYAG